MNGKTSRMLLLGLGAVIALVPITLIGLRVAGSRHWTQLMESHVGQLKAARIPDQDQKLLNGRYDAGELDGLPAPVQRYFRAVLKHGQPIIAAATIEMTGTINMSANGEQWKAFTSKQHVVTRRPGFLWQAQVAMYPGITAQVEDSYIAGQGRVLAKLLGLFTVAEVQGGGEYALGEFMRYFAEAAWYPTALLPSQGVKWQAVDDVSAQATIVDGPISLTLLFHFDETGLIASVRAESRGAGVGKDMLMLPWECGLSDYQPQHGMLIPMIGEAAWIRLEGRKAYFKGAVKTVSYEFQP
jgi:hypothetical protein